MQQNNDEGHQMKVLNQALKMSQSQYLSIKIFEEVCFCFSEEEMTLPGGGSENDLLRPIFDAIDTEKRGFITTEKFFEEMDRYSNSPMSAKKKVKNKN